MMHLLSMRNGNHSDFDLDQVQYAIVKIGQLRTTTTDRDCDKP